MPSWWKCQARCVDDLHCLMLVVSLLKLKCQCQSMISHLGQKERYLYLLVLPFLFDTSKCVSNTNIVCFFLCE